MPIFGALWTCMSSRYIRAQVLTLTKAHDEQEGPLNSMAISLKKYGFPEPPVAFSDDPVKDKGLLHTVFPSLAQDLKPIAAAHGLKPLKMSATTSVVVLSMTELAEQALAPIMSLLDQDPNAYLCMSCDAEWNMDRQVHRYHTLLPALLHLLVSNWVFKIGSNIKEDLTRLRKQFSQLDLQSSFNIIELKDYCIQRGILKRNESGTLDKLLEKAANMYISKDETLRKNDRWEDKNISPELLHYAVLDVIASRVIFEAVSSIGPLKRVTQQTPSGTRIAVLIQEGGSQVAAYAQHSWRCASHQQIFQQHSPTIHGQVREGLEIDALPINDDKADNDSDINDAMNEPDSSEVELQMLEAHVLIELKDPNTAGSISEQSQPDADTALPTRLQKLVESPPDAGTEYNQIKKDIFHAFNMIPTPLNHGMRPAFLCALHDHTLRWDPTYCC
ncbi:hypothetical protein H0H92_004296 [Tricholoma furcatifolium]|nr:hypothetical protein H0H92_004296 [Tricholoma furcatifolium]